MLQRAIFIATLFILGCVVLPTQAKTFRWSTQGDAATMDPQSQNETFNNMINGLAYEFLVDRDKNMEMSLPTRSFLKITESGNKLNMPPPPKKFSLCREQSLMSKNEN